MDCFVAALLAMTEPNSRHASAFPRRDAPEVFASFPHNGGRGECRVPAAPAVSCAMVEVAHEVVTTGSPEHPAFPHAMVLTVYSVLSPATNSSCHRHWRMNGMNKARSGRHALRQLDTSNGCQDHTASPSATTAVRPRALDRSQACSARPASSAAPDAAASTASRPASVTIAIRPSWAYRLGWAYINYHGISNSYMNFLEWVSSECPSQIPDQSKQALRQRYL
ncbi:MAG: hypothetical protein JWP25_3489 [Bradyrhizobium sp.]|jgi:hypothetical protein|nr:hypothetical protein [Bradyrhizobium sp.]